MPPRPERVDAYLMPQCSNFNLRTIVLTHSLLDIVGHLSAYTDISGRESDEPTVVLWGGASQIQGGASVLVMPRV